MTATLTPPPAAPGDPEPVWKLAREFPPQGHWTEASYLAMRRRTGSMRLIELVDGRLEFPPMPTKYHQAVAGWLNELLRNSVLHRGLGEVYMAPYRVRVPGRFREPDVVVILARNAAHAHDSHADRADLVVEVLSPDDSDRDLVVKRTEYAAAGAPEYWIADPQVDFRTLTVLTLEGDSYREHGAFGEGATAGSVLLPGVTLDVTACLAGQVP